MKIAITGATGQLGRLAIADLKKRGAGGSTIAIVRDGGKAADLGVETRIGDYRDGASLEKALAGIDRLVLISSNDFDDRFGQHRNAINAAKKAGIGQIIYTSILKGFDQKMLLAKDHQETEKAIAQSGIASTILRNGWYTENYTGSLGGAIAAGAMIGSAANGRLSTAARRDYAEAIGAVASGDGHAGKVYELAGDTAHTMAEMAAVVSKLTGKTIPYNNLPEKAYADILASFGLPSHFAAMLADADARAADGALFDGSGTLGRLIGRKTTPMAETVAAALN